jgi:dihydropteroate synthase
VSVDTRCAAVAERALAAGADMINDVSGGSHDLNMGVVAAATRASMVYMHMRGSPVTMTAHTRYSHDPSGDIAAELTALLESGLQAGVPRWMQIVDPGFGFAKDATTCEDLLRPRVLARLRALLDHRPIMIGLSRKRFLEHMLLQERAAKGLISHGISPENRDHATVGGCLAALTSSLYCEPDNRAPVILRVHNVKAVKDACDIYARLLFS